MWSFGFSLSLVLSRCVLFMRFSAAWNSSLSLRSFSVRDRRFWVDCESAELIGRGFGRFGTLISGASIKGMCWLLYEDDIEAVSCVELAFGLSSKSEKVLSIAKLKNSTLDSK